jgi:hypothetical protein
VTVRVAPCLCSLTSTPKLSAVLVIDLMSCGCCA